MSNPIRGRFSLALLALLALPGSARAESIVVLEHGGVTAIDVYQIGDDPGRLERTATLPLLAEGAAPIAPSSARALGAGSLLVTRPASPPSLLGPDPPRFAAPPPASLLPEAAAVWARSAESTIESLIVAGAPPGRVSIWEARSGLGPSLDLRTSAGAPRASSIVALGPDRAAVALRAGATPAAVVIASIKGAALSEIARFGGAEHSELSDALDLGAIRGGPLIITAPSYLIGIDPESARLLWSVSIAELGLAGRFAAARPLSRDRLAVATLEPGQWTAPHPHHGVHIVSIGEGGAPPSLIASSGPLARAPRLAAPLDRLDGTGTLGWSALTTDRLAPLNAAGPLSIDPPTARAGTVITASITLTNVTDARAPRPALGLAWSEARSCAEARSRGDVALRAGPSAGAPLEPGESAEIAFVLTIGATDRTGSVCLAPAIANEAGAPEAIWELGEVLMIEPASGARSPLPVEELELVEADPAPDAGAISASASGAGDGCGCASSPGRASGGPWLALFLLALVRRQRAP